MDANERESRAAKLSREHSRHAVENLGQFRVAFFHPRLFAFIRIHSRGKFLIRKEVSPVYSHAFTVSHFDGANNIRFFGIDSFQAKDAEAQRIATTDEHRWTRISLGARGRRERKPKPF